jgi:hypothetical protein
MNRTPSKPPAFNGSPEEPQIEALLKRIQPRPSQRFHDQMADAPWNRAEQKSRHPALRWSMVSLLALLIITLTFIGLLALPSFHALAQQIRLFFWHTPSDQLELTTLPPGTTSPYTASETPPAQLSIEAIKTLAGYPLLVPQELPQGLHFLGASYDPVLQAVTLRYGSLNHTLLITQRPSGEIQEYSTVGASAPVETLRLRGGEAELVSGGWRVATPSPGSEVQTTPGDVTWDSELHQHILRWQESGMIYEILSSGEGYLSDQELIRLAESLK